MDQRMVKKMRPRMRGGKVIRAAHLGKVDQRLVLLWVTRNGKVMVFQMKRKKPVNMLPTLKEFFFLALFLAFFLVTACWAPNFIFARGLRGGVLGGEDLAAVPLVVDLRAVFRGDVLVVFLAGMIRLLCLFWGKTGRC